MRTLRDPHRPSSGSLRSRRTLVALAIGVALLCLLCLTAPVGAQATPNRFTEAPAAAAARTDSLYADEIARLTVVDVSPFVVRRLRVIDDSLRIRENELREAIAAAQRTQACLLALPDSAAAAAVRACFAPELAHETRRAFAYQSVGQVLGDGVVVNLEQRRVPSQGAQIATFLASVGTGYVVGRQDHDAGDYVDSWRFGPDKQAHFGLSVPAGTLTSAAAGDAWGFASCTAGAAALELGQSWRGGRFSWHDLGYGSGGCATGVVVKHVVAFLLR